MAKEATQTVEEKVKSKIAAATPEFCRAIKNSANAVAVAKASGDGSETEEAAFAALLLKLVA